MLRTLFAGLLLVGPVNAGEISSMEKSPPEVVDGSTDKPALTLAPRYGGTEQAKKESLLPDPKLTPCKADPSLTKQVLCKKGFSTSEDRLVEESTKEKVCEEYGLPKDCNSETAANGKHEIDHCIALTDGGANDIDNLWPQSYVTKPWNAHVKDDLEVHLHFLICKDKMTLEAAQDCLKQNWITCYHRILGRKLSR